MSGFVEFTFCDHEANEFVTLGRTPPMEPDALSAFYAALEPPNDPDSPFLADLWSDGDCHDDDRAVSVLAIERELGAPLDTLMERGRKKIRDLQRAIRETLTSRATL